MEKFCHRGGRRGIETFLKPDQIHVKVRFLKKETEYDIPFLIQSKYGGFAEVWAGSYNTVAVAKSGEVIFAHITVKSKLLGSHQFYLGNVRF